MHIICGYNKYMRIEFDPTKDKANVIKHGVSLAEAINLDWDSAVETEDDRDDYSEMRMYALAPLGKRLHAVIYTDRDDVRRIISLRKANKREVSNYVEAKS